MTCAKCGGYGPWSPKGHQSWCDRLVLTEVGTWWDGTPHFEYRLRPEETR